MQPRRCQFTQRITLIMHPTYPNTETNRIVGIKETQQRARLTDSDTPVSRPPHAQQHAGGVAFPMLPGLVKALRTHTSVLHMDNPHRTRETARCTLSGHSLQSTSSLTQARALSQHEASLLAHPSFPSTPQLQRLANRSSPGIKASASRNAEKAGVSWLVARSSSQKTFRRQAGANHKATKARSTKLDWWYCGPRTCDFGGACRRVACGAAVSCGWPVGATTQGKGSLISPQARALPGLGGVCSMDARHEEVPPHP